MTWGTWARVAGVVGCIVVFAREVVAQDARGGSGKEGEVQLKVHAYAQADGRFFPGGAAALGTSTFLLRRARLIADAGIGRSFAVRLAPDFGQGRVALFDAYLDLRLGPELLLRAGKARPPTGLERHQSATDIRFIERGLPTNLVPNRDVGVQAIGDLAGGLLSYSVGVFNGVPDLGNLDGDATSDKDLGARVFLQPFRKTSARALRGLGIGATASTGNERGIVSAPGLATYVTPGQQPMFRYRDSTVANGRRSRLAPQAYYYAGPFAALGEYVVSSQAVSRGSATVDPHHHSWQVAASWYLTGEQAAFTSVAPRRPFDPSKKQWGAVEIAARYGEITFDEAAFPTFVNQANSVRDAKAWGVAATWHFVRGAKLAVNYEETRFTGGAASGDRAAEHFFVTRFQQSF